MMKKRPISDREVYPALWITLGALGIAFFLWRYPLGRPTVRACWFYTQLHVYCPACGGTRSLLALFHGHPLLSLYYHPAVVLSAVFVGGYLLSQTVWRLRGRQGWALHYTNRWLWWLLALLVVNCLVRNILWLGFHIPI